MRVIRKYVYKIFKAVYLLEYVGWNKFLIAVLSMIRYQFFESTLNINKSQNKTSLFIP